MTLMQSNDKEARWKERGRVTCAQRFVQQEVDGHSSIYTDFTGCTSAYSSTHYSTAVKDTSNPARWYTSRNQSTAVKINMFH